MPAIDDLTARQRQVLDYIRQHLRQHGRTPTFREIASHFGLRSPNSVNGHIKALIRKKQIRRSPNISRGIELLSRDGRCPCCLQAIPGSGKDN